MLADIFQTLAQNQQSGLLTLRGPEGDHRVLFSQMGITLSDAAAFRAPRLGHLLTAARKVLEEPLDAAMHEIDRDAPNLHSSVNLLVMLEEKGHLPLSEGVRILRTEVMEELFDLFLIEDEMEFEFIDDEIPVEAIPRECFFRVEEVVMEAARRLDDTTRMSDVINRDEFYVMVQAAAETDPIAGLLDGSQTLIDIAERLALSRFDVARHAYGLAVEERLRVASADELVQSARSLDPKAHRQRLTRICLRAAQQLSDEDSRLDQVAEMLVQASANRDAITILLKRARAHLDHGNHETAYTQLLLARDLNPNHIGILSMLADMHAARSEKGEEIKILTMLAERCAAEELFSEAVDYCARVARLFPDSPLLDHSFLLYCQKSDRHSFGAEVLTNAANKRSNPTRAALLYNGILLLDPTRSDVKRLLNKNAKGRLTARVVWGAGVVALIPIVGFVAHRTMQHMETQRFLGRIDSAESLLANNEPDLAMAQLKQLLDADLSDALRARVDSLRMKVEVQQTEKQVTERDTQERLTRELLTSIQEAIDSGDYSGATRQMFLALDDVVDEEDQRRLATKLSILLLKAREEQREIDRMAGQFSMPDHDNEIAETLTKYSGIFSSETLGRWRDLERELIQLPAGRSWEESHKDLTKTVASVVSTLEQVRPSILDLESRVHRIEALDVLSVDYEEILEAEKKGDFLTASRSYDRLLHEYGEGTLTDFLRGRRDDTQHIQSELDQIQKLATRGDIEAAHERALALAAETTEYDLLAIVGAPVRIETIPRGSMLKSNDGVIGVAPQIYYAKSRPAIVTAQSPGFNPAEVEIDSRSNSTLLIGMQRDAIFQTSLKTRFEATPAAVGKDLFVGGRDGILYKLSLQNGTVTSRYETTSLNGITSPPIIFDDLVVVAVDEGNLYGIDRMTMRPRWSRELGDALVGPIFAGSDQIVAVLRDGRVFEIDPSNGKSRQVAAISETPSTGAVLLGSIIAVGTTNGQVIGISRQDGQVRFRSKSAPQPATGLSTDGASMFVGYDSGRILSLDIQGTVNWSIDAGASLGTAPRISDGFVVVGAGRNALVLNTRDGSIRAQFEVEDWIAAPPTIGGGRLYVGDRLGHVTVVDLQVGQPLFRQQLDGVLGAAPKLVGDNVALVTQNGTVHLIGN